MIYIPHEPHDPQKRLDWEAIKRQGPYEVIVPNERYVAAHSDYVARELMKAAERYDFDDDAVLILNGDPLATMLFGQALQEVAADTTVTGYTALVYQRGRGSNPGFYMPVTVPVY